MSIRRHCPALFRSGMTSAARAGRPGLSLVLDLLATGAVLGAAGAASLRFLLG